MLHNAYLLLVVIAFGLSIGSLVSERIRPLLPVAVLLVTIALLLRSGP
jgi:hypothetical protein